MPTRVLMAGESWTTHSTHVKGFDSFTTSSYNEGGTELIAALDAGGVEVTYQPSHVAADHFPSTREALAYCRSAPSSARRSQRTGCSSSGRSSRAAAACS